MNQPNVENVEDGRGKRCDYANNAKRIKVDIKEVEEVFLG